MKEVIIYCDVCGSSWPENQNSTYLQSIGPKDEHCCVECSRRIETARAAEVRRITAAVLNGAITPTYRSGASPKEWLSGRPSPAGAAETKEANHG